MALQLLTQIDLLAETVNADANARLTEQQLLAETVNADANARLTQTDLVASTINASTQARLTQISLLSETVNANANARLTEIVFLGIANRPPIAESCAYDWTIPTPTAFPLPSVGGPQFTMFKEVTPQWSEFGQAFGDGKPWFGTIQTTRIRYFEVEWDGLSSADATTLDNHHNSTRGILSFTVTVPRTAEVITNVRYASYTRSSHTRYWSQSRSARLVKYL